MQSNVQSFQNKFFSSLRTFGEIEAADFSSLGSDRRLNRSKGAIRTRQGGTNLLLGLLESFGNEEKRRLKRVSFLKAWGRINIVLNIMMPFIYIPQIVLLSKGHTEGFSISSHVLLVMRDYSNANWALFAALPAAVCAKDFLSGTVKLLLVFLAITSVAIA